MNKDDEQIILNAARDRRGSSVTTTNILHRALQSAGHKFDKDTIERVLRTNGYTKKVGFPTSFDAPKEGKC